MDSSSLYLISQLILLVLVGYQQLITRRTYRDLPYLVLSPLG